MKQTKNILALQKKAFTLVFDGMIIKVSVIRKIFSLDGFAMTLTQPLRVMPFSVQNLLREIFF